jgi:hypothetical protein
VPQRAEALPSPQPSPEKRGSSKAIKNGLYLFILMTVGFSRFQATWYSLLFVAREYEYSESSSGSATFFDNVCFMSLNAESHNFHWFHATHPE